VHVIVVGCGRVGVEVSRRLIEHGHDVVVIDRRADAFRKLPHDFPGRTINGIGFDRDTLTEAGITPDGAVLAVTSGDNSNILTVRVARETFAVDRVVARIYDPRRAAIYERLGIPTVASVAWQSARVLQHILPTAQSAWLDPSAQFALVERRVPAAAAGRTVADLAEHGLHVALICRHGTAQLPTPGALLQQDDLVHVMMAADRAAHIDEILTHTEAH
jgi:trk system potassium uptake protein TrkA